MYLLLSSANNGTLRCVADSLQYGCLACVCPSYDKDSELDIWNWTTGLFGVHCRNGVWKASESLSDLIPSSKPSSVVQWLLTNRVDSEDFTPSLVIFFAASTFYLGTHHMLI